MALKIKNQDTLEELKKEAKHTSNGRYQLRLKVIIKAKEGVKSKQIQKELMISQHSYYYWVHTYNSKGKEALKKIKITGRKEGNPKWDKKIFEKLFIELDKMKEYWSITKMQKWIKKEYNQDIPYSTIEHRLHKAQYSWKSNRPSPYKGNKDKQEDFKKKASINWSKR